MSEMKLIGVEEAVAALKAIAADIDSAIVDVLEDSGQEMADAMNAEDRLNVAHDTFTVHRRKASVAVGPSRAGRRAHIVRFHEFGTVHHKATPLMRRVADRWDRNVKAKFTKKVREAADRRKKR